MKLRALKPLEIALGASIAVHAVLLTVRFVDPERFSRVFKDSPLDVILVNGRTQDQAVNPTAIAQASMAGGGDADAGRATTWMPPSMLNSPGDAETDSQRQVETLHEQQTVLLTQIKKALADMPVNDPEVGVNDPATKQREERRKKLTKMLAEIERRINEENARPKKRYISPSTREEAYAVYYDSLRQKIEKLGTTNFPQSKGHKLYGELTMVVTVNHDGRVLATEVLESSGSATLDRQARAIARNAAPFGKFNAAMRRRADQLVIVSRFKFTHDETLQARVGAN